MRSDPKTHKAEQMLILIGQYKTCADFQGKPGNFMAADTQINDDK